MLSVLQNVLLLADL